MENFVFPVLGFDTSKAACKGLDNHIFYPDITCKTLGARHYQQRAKEICKTCVVIEPCLEYGVRYEPTGVWGGKTEVEREAIRIRRNIELPLDRLKPDTVKRAKRTGRLARMVRTGEDE